MGDLVIRRQRISPEEIEGVTLFMRDSDFLWSDLPTLDYIINTLNPLDSHHILVYDGNTIIGCNLFIYSLAKMNGEYTSIAWSISTFLSPAYRRYVGLFFFLSVYECKNVLGFGVTDLNHKLLSLIGANDIATSYGYILRNDIYKESIHPSRMVYPSDLFVKGKHFLKVNLSSEIRSPNNGYWNKDMTIDFIRDSDFINKRFFLTPWQYMIYRLPGNEESADDLYFVCRIRYNKGKRTLFLVDYRFNIDYDLGMDYVVEALYQLSIINNVEESLVFTSLTSKLSTKRGELERFGEESHIITNITSINPKSVMITPADSDCDLIPLSI